MANTFLLLKRSRNVFFEIELSHCLYVESSQQEAYTKHVFSQCFALGKK